MERWAFIDDGPVEPVLNMASDDALLASVARMGSPVLRWYGWTVPAATFGYFQPRAVIEGWTRVRPLLRRPTGGGLVPHLDDWTYALALPPGHPWHGLRAPDSYERMHRWLAAALRDQGIPAVVADCCEPSGPGRCFEGWEKFDVLCHGRKIAGAAQRRNRDGLLIQGSIQPLPHGLSRDAFAAALRAVASREWQVSWHASDDPAWREAATRLVPGKHALQSYQAGR